MQELAKLQREDSVIKIVREWFESESRPEWSEVSKYGANVKYYWYRWESLTIENDVVYRKWEDDYGKNVELQILLPQCLKGFVMTQLHDNVGGGHLGVKKTLSKIRKRFFWYGLRKDVEKWCRKCDKCAARKTPRIKPKAQMKQCQTGARWERIAIDFIGVLPKSEKGNKYLMVVVDYFTKWVEAVPLADIEARTVAEALISHILQRYGVPLSIHTDQGAQFESNLFQEMCKLLGIHKTRTTPYRPQSDGLVERANRTILNMLKAYVADDQRDWDRHVPLCLMAYRTSVHQSTGVTPSTMMYGSDIRLPVDLVFGKPEIDKDERKTHYGVEFVQELEERLDKVHEFARNKMSVAGGNMKKFYDRKINQNLYSEGDKVWYHDSRRRVGICNKLKNEWSGPYTVITRISDILYRIQENTRRKPKVVHHDKLKPYEV